MSKKHASLCAVSLIACVCVISASPFGVVRIFAQESAFAVESAGQRSGLSGYWDESFYVASPPVVHTVHVDESGRAFVLGRFSAFSGILTTNIAVWNGEVWSGIPFGVGYVRTIDSEGNVYKSAGSNAVYRWDGIEWTSLGTLEYPVRRIVVDGFGTVYATGCLYERHRLVAATGVVRRDGDTWVRLPASTDCDVSIFAGDDGFLYSHASGSLARWEEETSEWITVTDDIPLGQVKVLADGRIYAYRTTLHQWNQGVWNELIPPAFVTSISDIDQGPAGTLYLATRTDSTATILSFDGASWTVEATPLIGFVSSMDVDSDSIVYVGGDFRNPDSAGENLARWVGDRWHFFADTGQGFAGRVDRVVSSTSGEIFVSGWSSQNAPRTKRMWRWAENRFERIDDNRYDVAITTLEDSRLVAGRLGSQTIGIFDGDGWIDIPNPGCAPDSVAPGIYTAIVGPEQSLHLAGSCTRQRAIVARWNGTQWERLGEFHTPIGGMSAAVRSLEFDAQGNLFVGGMFVRVNDIDAKGIARWDGQEWSALGSGLYASFAWSGEATALKWFDNKLFVGGAFTRAGDLEVANVAAWENEQWRPAGHFNGGVRSFAVDAELGLFAGGWFQWSHTRATSMVAHWDGEAWEAVGEGIIGKQVDAVAVGNDRSLWIGGDFYGAGNLASSNIARWISLVSENEPPEEETVVLEPSLSAFPNPFSDELRVRFESPGQTALTLELYDVLGRRVALLHEGNLDANEKLELGFPVRHAAGVYFLVANNGFVVQVRPVIKAATAR